MKNLIYLPIAALVLAACSSTATKSEAPGPAAADAGLNAQRARITDERILADRETIERVQQRLRKLNESGIPQNSYPLAKAQCWLDTAKTQYHENDRTGYIEESISESVKIVRALEADRNSKAGYDTPLVARSTKLRDDLWSKLGEFKASDATLACNARTVACAELRLVRAGHAEEQTGWRQATPHVQMAEDAIRRAGAEAASCVVARPVETVITESAVVPRAVPVPAPVEVKVVPPAPVMSKETITLADTLFKYKKSGRDDMLPGGQEKLAQVAQRLKKYESIQSLVVVGHTDRLASHQYNDRLSAARAATVRAELERLGVKSAQFVTQGKGKREPVTRDCADKLPREQLIQCLQPDRRVTIEVTGVIK